MSLVVSARYHGRPLGRPYHYDKVCHTTVRKDPPCLGASARILQGALSDALTSTTKSAIQLFEKILRASAPPRVITGALSDALTTSAKSTIQLFEKTSSLGVSARYHGHPIGRPYHYDKVCHTTVRKDPLCLGASARTSRSSSAATCDTPAFSACNISNP